MADLTLIQRFGNNVSYNATSKALTLNLNDLSSITVGGENLGLDVGGMTDANKDSYASRILWALLLKSQSVQPENNNDETIGLYVQNQGKRSVVRNSVSQFGFVLAATAYKTDTVGTQLDPDAIAV